MNKFKQILIPLIITLVLSVNVFPQDISNIQPAFEILSKYTNVRDFTMNQNGDEAYVSIQSPLGEISTIAVIKKKKGKWQNPKMVSFSGKFKDLEPFFAPNGLTLYFVSNRTLDKSSGKTKDMDIWYVERKTTKSKWSEPINLGLPINTDDDEFYPSVANNGNLYFTKEKEGPNKKPDIMFSSWNGKSFSAPIALSNAINTDQDEFNSYIAPDESFIIFGGWRRKDGVGSGDLYISFLNTDKTWKKAENLGKGINSVSMDYCPFVDWKTKTLYFTSRRSEIKPNNFKSLKDFEYESNKYQNGLSRIYKTSIADKLSQNTK